TLHGQAIEGLADEVTSVSLLHGGSFVQDAPIIDRGEGRRHSPSTEVGTFPRLEARPPLAKGRPPSNIRPAAAAVMPGPALRGLTERFGGLSPASRGASSGLVQRRRSVRATAEAPWAGTEGRRESGH